MCGRCKVSCCDNNIITLINNAFDRFCHLTVISWSLLFAISTEIHLDLKRRMESYNSWKNVSDEEGVDESSLLAITYEEFESEY